MSEEPVALVPKAGGEAGGRGRRLVGPRRAPSGLFRPHEARFAAHEAPKATIAPFTTRSRRALRGIRPSGTARLYADRAFLSRRLGGTQTLVSAALVERASQTLDFAGCWVRNPASVFAVLGEVLPLFLAISGYFWVGCVPRWAGLKINYFARHR